MKSSGDNSNEKQKHLLVRIYKHLEPVCPLLWGLNPPKQGPFQAKQGSFGFQAIIMHNNPSLTTSNSWKLGFGFFRCFFDKKADMGAAGC